MLCKSITLKNKMLEADPNLEKIFMLATNNLDNAEESVNFKE